MKETDKPERVEIKIAPSTWYFMYLKLPDWHFIRTGIKGGVIGFLWGMDIFMFRIPLVKAYFAIKYLISWLS